MVTFLVHACISIKLLYVQANWNLSVFSQFGSANAEPADFNSCMLALGVSNLCTQPPAKQADFAMHALQSVLLSYVA